MKMVTARIAAIGFYFPSCIRCLWGRFGSGGLQGCCGGRSEAALCQPQMFPSGPTTAPQKDTAEPSGYIGGTCENISYWAEIAKEGERRDHQGQNSRKYPWKSTLITQKDCRLWTSPR